MYEIQSKSNQTSVELLRKIRLLGIQNRAKEITSNRTPMRKF